jgi:HAD superfamily hydrolase (TIGR01509 family)
MKAIIFDFFGVICTYVGFDNVVILNRELLDKISKLKPDYKMAILSNASQEFIEKALEQNGVRNLFDVVVTSSKTGFVKPQPEIFEHTLNELQVQPEEALFIDDSSSNVTAAKEMGLNAISYKGLDNLGGEFKLKKIV